MNLEMSLLTSKTWLILGEPWGCRFFTMSLPLYMKILINCYFKEKLLQYDDDMNILFCGMKLHFLLQMPILHI